MAQTLINRGLRAKLKAIGHGMGSVNKHHSRASLIITKAQAQMGCALAYINPFLRLAESQGKIVGS
jgi:hypothetical protein